MIIVYGKNEKGMFSSEITNTNKALLSEALWIDLISPTRKEEKLIEEYIDLDVPTKKEMSEIEPSSRLYIEDDALFMTATMVANSDTPEPIADAVTFILTEKLLITIRYIEPYSFKLFIAKLLRHHKNNYNYDAQNLLVGLLETTTDRLADILENVSHKFEKLQQVIFRGTSRLDYIGLLQTIGINGELGNKARESLVSFIRLVSFLDQTTGSTLKPEIHSRLTIINKDIKALSDYAGFISTKVDFLLEATLGMVNIEQSNIIKIFSVAAVIFLPPTLVASIYGMNFRFMPELDWHLGYPFAIVLMVLAAILPYMYFKKRKWL